jgi:mannose-6-phosphate isomerase-like protein (cupin superfamily)
MRSQKTPQHPQDQVFTPSYASRSGFVRKGLRSFWEYRDLGVAAATQGRFKATVLRSLGKSPEGGTGWHFHRLDFQFYYVLKGWMKTRVEGQGLLTFNAGDSFVQPPGTRHNVFEFSEDLELLEVVSPAEFGAEECEPAE